MTRKQELTVIVILLTACLAAAVIGVLRTPAERDEEPEVDPAEETTKAEVVIQLPDSSRGDTADASVTNIEGYTYNYRIFSQKAGYDNYSDYISAHGCSACALTTILRTSVPELSELTPDKTITDIIYPAAGDKVFNKNFGKAPRRQMPITLAGMTGILDEYGVEYKRPSSDPDKRAKQITKWLKKGDPVIFTFGNAKEAHLSRYTHTILLLGIDKDGKVIIGDSLHKSEVYWGKDGLIKSGKLTVKELLSYIRRDGDWTVNQDSFEDRRFFYKDSADRGYLLIRNGGND